MGDNERQEAAYDWSRFHVGMYYRASVARVFEAWSTARGLESFFLGGARHTDGDGHERGPDECVAADDRYEWDFLHDYRLVGRFTAVEPGRRVAFTFGSMHVDVSFARVEDATRVVLRQTGCALVDPARAWQHVNCRSCWIYFMTNLRSVLGQGVDLRDHEQTEWNDSVSIGWDPAADAVG